MSAEQNQVRFGYELTHLCPCVTSMCTVRVVVMDAHEHFLKLTKQKSSCKNFVNLNLSVIRLENPNNAKYHVITQIMTGYASTHLYAHVTSMCTVCVVVLAPANISLCQRLD